ncbi:hypothetical protein APHAL10511_001377 [Amanita phalloides]|nr:hypothetical protein APHAL10511_001377 [Amanita phalloides]
MVEDGISRQESRLQTFRNTRRNATISHNSEFVQPDLRRPISTQVPEPKVRFDRDSNKLCWKSTKRLRRLHQSPQQLNLFPDDPPPTTGRRPKSLLETIANKPSDTKLAGNAEPSCVDPESSELSSHKYLRGRSHETRQSISTYETAKSQLTYDDNISYDVDR